MPKKLSSKNSNEESSSAEIGISVEAADRYRLSAEECQRRIADLLADRPPETQSSAVCYLLDTDDEAADVARTTVASVFSKLGDTPEDMARIYGRYEGASRYLLSVDLRAHRAMGGAIIIENSPAGLMTVNVLRDKASEALDAPIEEILQLNGMDINDLDDYLDIGAVGVLPEYRNSRSGAGAQLYRALNKVTRERGATDVINIFQPKPFETLKTSLGVPVRQMKGTHPFSFEKTTDNIAGHIDMSEMDDALQEHLRRIQRIDRLKFLAEFVSKLAYDPADGELIFR